MTQLKHIVKANHEKLLFITLGIVTFYLSIYFSKDWKHYNWLYEHEIANTTWQAFLSKFSLFKEPLFFILAKAVSQLIGFSAFVFFATVVLLTIKLHFLSKIIKSPYLGTFFYTCFYLLLFEGTALRIGYAVALIVSALYCLKGHKFLYAFLLIVVASQIHLTALIFLLVFPLYFIRWLNILVYLAFILFPLFIVFDISILNILRDLIAKINPKYLFYFGESRLVIQNSTGLFFYFITFFAILLAVVFFYMKELIKNDRFISVVFSITLCGVILMWIFNDIVAVGARFGELLLVPIVILLSHLYMHFSLNKMFLNQVALVSLSLIYFVSRLAYLYPAIIGR